MLQLKQITKSYTTGDFTQIALDDVSLSFRRSEFVAILGQSGSGKTTCLNVVGGLDRYDSGDLVINNKSTKHFTDAEWDAYRNNSVGFIFQSYNLITHLNILDNVEIGMTLSGVPAEQKRRVALEVLDRVGLKDHVHKKPNQLSGGQMQRVAIARALANDPDIILADEPTGSLDTETSKQIMDLIKEIAIDKLVIMVTHNSDLAERYADRIVNFKDGLVVGDSNPYETSGRGTDYVLKKTSMNFLTALKLSGTNIATKKWRTALTAFASSIGIIGIALVLSLSTGFQSQIDDFQRDAMSEFPVIISQQAMTLDEATRAQMRGEMAGWMGRLEYTDSSEVFLYDPAEESVVHSNKLTDDLIQYVEAIDPEICTSIGYTRLVGMNLLRRVDDRTFPVSISIGVNVDMNRSDRAGMSGMSDAGLVSYPESLDSTSVSYLEKNHDLLAGTFPVDETGLVLVIDNHNRIDQSVLKNLGFWTGGVDSIDFDEIVGTELRLISNNDYFVPTSFGNFLPGQDFDAMYESEAGISLIITGIVRLKRDVNIGIIGNGIAYSDKLVQRVVDMASNSDIVLTQKAVDYNVMSMQPLSPDEKATMLTYLGADTTPFMVFLYPRDFDSKEAVLSYLDAFNVGRAAEDHVVYTDLASTITQMTGGIMNAITMVLVAFASISLIVSLIMIGIITYISVLERTKEIGVLRALGARKKDITRVFNAETFIIGIFSGTLGIVIAYALTIPINQIIENLTDLKNVARLNPLHALLLMAISLVLTIIGGAIPARMAATKDPVEALRAE